MIDVIMKNEKSCFWILYKLSITQRPHVLSVGMQLKKERCSWIHNTDCIIASGVIKMNAATTFNGCNLCFSPTKKICRVANFNLSLLEVQMWWVTKSRQCVGVGHKFSTPKAESAAPKNVTISDYQSMCRCKNCNNKKICSLKIMHGMRCVGDCLGWVALCRLVRTCCISFAFARRLITKWWLLH